RDMASPSWARTGDPQEVAPCSGWFFSLSGLEGPDNASCRVQNPGDPSPLLGIQHQPVCAFNLMVGDRTVASVFGISLDRTQTSSPRSGACSPPPANSKRYAVRWYSD